MPSKKCGWFSHEHEGILYSVSRIYAPRFTFHISRFTFHVSLITHHARPVARHAPLVTLPMNWLNAIFIFVAAFLAVFWEAAFNGVRHLLGAQIDLLPPLMVYASLTAG